MKIVKTLHRAAIAGGLSLTLTGCLTTDSLIRVSGQAMSLATSMDTSIEKQQWLASASEGELLRQNPESVDTDMQRKLQKIVDHIVEANNLQDFEYKIHLLANDRINAFTPGGGVIFVEEGLVAQTKTEAMMAMVLAHEIAHIVKAHPAVGMRDRSLLNIGAIVLGDYVGQSVTAIDPAVALKLLNYAHQAAVSGYGRAAETEADQLGFEYYVKAGYKSSAAPDIFYDFARVFGAAPAIEHFFHGTHPQAHERASRLRELASEMGTRSALDGIEQTDEWARLVASYASRSR